MRYTRKKLSDLTDIETRELEKFLNCHFCTVFHDPHFNIIVSEVFQTEGSYLLAHGKNGNLIGICPLHSVKSGIVKSLYSGLGMYDIPYGGWIYNDSAVVLSDLLMSMKFALNEGLSYRSIPQIDKNDYSSIEDVIEFQTGIIDLNPPLEEILQKNISRKRRQSIRLAARKGVEVEELDPARLDIFLGQCRNLKESIGVEPFPDEFFYRLYAHYYNSGQILALASKLGHDYLGSGIMIGNKHMTHLWIAGKSKAASINVPRQELLLWESVKWAKERGSRYFDLCVLEPERLPDIAQFKLSFSKMAVPFFHIAQKSISYRVLNKLQNWIRRA